MQKQSHFVSLIVPVFKKETIILQNVGEIKKTLDTIRYPSEIIVVVDGMVDNTHKILKKAHMPDVRVIAYKENKGKAYAVRTGMQKAKGDYVMFLDSGMEIDPNGISMLLEHMEWYNADIIVGSKRHPASQVEYSSMRKVLSYGYFYFVKLLFGISVKDTQAGIKVFRKPVLKKILSRLVEKKFAGDLEMLVAAQSMGFTRIYESPIKLKYDLKSLSDAATLRSIWGIMVDTLAIWYRKNILQYYS